MNIKLALKKAKYLLPSSTVLMLHHVSPGESTDSITLTKRHLEELLNGFSCFARVDEVTEKPALKRIALSFDDGYEDLFTVVYPLLQGSGVPFTAFIAPSFLDTPGYLTRAQLLELARDPLVTLGSHSLTHLCLKGQNEAVQKEELLRSKELLESLSGCRVDLLAYPNGQADDTTYGLLKQKNAYRYAFLAAGGGINMFCKQPFALPRLRMDEKTFSSSMELLTFAYGGAAAGKTE